MKTCSKCKRELPKNTDYFFKKKGTKDGLMNSCKECEGNKFTNKLTKIPKDGHKFCIKCDRELKINIRFFPPDKACKDGLRSVCRECGKDGHFMEEGYVPKTCWNSKDEKILTDNYSTYTNQELIDKFFPNETKKSLQNKAYLLGVTGKDEQTLIRVNAEMSEKMAGENSPSYGKEVSEETRKKLSESIRKYYSTHNGVWLGRKRSEEEKQKMSIRMKGNWAGNKNPRHKNPLRGSDNPNWKGGKTPLYFELRSEIQDWKKSSMEYWGYKCAITGMEFDVIHHLHPFRDIVTECFEITQLEEKKCVTDYTGNEFELLRQTLIELHENYGHGICLIREIHKLFHDIYGYTKNSKEQFDEFTTRLKNGEFNDFLKENNLSLKIK